MGSILSVKALSKSYERAGHKTLAVNNVSLELHSGEILGIVGSSGSGKSTLLRLIGKTIYCRQARDPDDISGSRSVVSPAPDDRKFDR